MFDHISDTTISLPDGPAAAARLLEPALAQAAGPNVESVSLTLDYGAPAVPGTRVTVEAELERATRTLAFVFGRIVGADGSVLATGSAVFRRVIQAA
jgi:acyl-coenzyme A thioesterase PaaI-like protein